MSVFPLACTSQRLLSATFAAFLSPAFASAAWAQEMPPSGEGAAPVAVETAPPEETTDPGTAAATSTEQLPAAEDEVPPAEESGTEILSAQTLSLLVDGRIVGADGFQSWLDGGFSKARFDGTRDGDFQLRPYPVQATFIWQPRFFSGLGGTVTAGWQLEQEEAFDIMEAYLTFRPNPAARTRFFVRAGIFWPNISLEHAGAAWSVTETITPSAINAWISEEVKVLGLEATATTMLGEHEVSLTGAGFGFNDTSGTLLSFRGWALHDINATVFGYFPLPPLSAFITSIQAPETKSFIELDDRVGWYVNFEWRPPWPFAVNLFYYDNRGDPEVFNEDRQWGWRTRFWNLGFNADLGPDTRLLAQGMTGTTLLGFFRDGNEFVDTRFRSAYLLVRHNLTADAAISGRFDWFETRETGSRMDNVNESEDGWAITAAGRMAVAEGMTAFIEAMHIQSERGVRSRLGQPAEENQTVVQLGLRLEL